MGKPLLTRRDKLFSQSHLKYTQRERILIVHIYKEIPKQRNVRKTSTNYRQEISKYLCNETHNLRKETTIFEDKFEGKQC